MKKSILFLIVILLSACQSAPQVTVTPEATATLPPTETPIPTPTLNPQFAALQETIASSVNRFTLNAADGLVYDGTEPVPGLHVAPDGTMTMTVDGETVTLNPADMSFNDEMGITIKGYELDEGTGAWVVAVPTPEELWQLELSEWQLNPEDYSEKKDVDGNLAMVKKSTGEIMYWVDENEVGYWNLQVMRKMIVATNVEDKMCQRTSYVGIKGQSVPPIKNGDLFSKNYMHPFGVNAIKILKEMDFPYKSFLTYDYLGGDNNCWATEPVGSVGKTADMVEETVIFWKSANQSGAILYEKVFNPKIKKITLVK